MKKVILLLSIALTSFASFGQIKGKVIDAETKEVLVGATISNGKTGVTSGLDGTFDFKTAKTGEKFKTSFVGYAQNEVVAKDGITIELKSTSIGLKEVAVIASYGIDRKTPAAISSIGTKFAVENFHGKNPYPTRLLFVDESLYKWKFLESHAAACFYTGKNSESKETYNKILQAVKDHPQSFSPEDLKKIEMNGQFFK